MEISRRFGPGITELFRRFHPERKGPQVALLEQFLNEQREENKDLKLEKGAILTKEELLERYRLTPLFEKLDQEAVRQFSDADTTTLVDLGHRFAGRLFEDLAYFQLAQAQSEDTLLLSPNRTSSLFQALYPDEEKYPRMQDPFGGISIKGITVPDGLIVWEQKNGPIITAVCEYKAGMSGKHNSDNSMLVYSLTAVNVGRKISPEIFSPSPRLIVVSQRNAVLPTARAVVHQADKIDLIGLPFDNHEYRQIVDDFLVPYLAPKEPILSK